MHTGIRGHPRELVSNQTLLEQSSGEASSDPAFGPPRKTWFGLYREEWPSPLVKPPSLEHNSYSSFGTYFPTETARSGRPSHRVLSPPPLHHILLLE